ncbi:MAG: NAD(+) diphosphatase [Treponema sp.]|nr:NAD(+) diphosphatase [Treponema sp.]
MNKSNAFFFQGDLLLLPQDIPETQITDKISIELAEVFADRDIFEVPAPAGSEDSRITVVSVSGGQPLPAGWKSITVRQAISLLNAGGGEISSALAGILRCCHIAQWRRNSRFCGACGAENNDSEEELARCCPACGRVEFPRISPAIITAITNEKDEMLLAHNKNFITDMYSHIAGFNEPGESLEQTVVREIREEINIEVRDIRYAGSQPWPFPSSLMIGFRAKYSGGTIRPDGIEIEDARWFSRDNLPRLPGPGSLSRRLIDRWLEGAL